MDALGGVLVGSGIGYQHYFNSNLGMSFAFGYRYNGLRYKSEKDYKLLFEQNRLSLKFGILFK
jgi:hypothetical protein